MSEHTLVGTWSLVSATLMDGEGMKIAEPYGPNPRGMLIYAEDGSVSVHLMRASRSQCRSDFSFEASPEEKVLAFDTYSGYCGTYTQQGNRVIHHVMASFFPNWVGTDLVRLVKLDGDLLTLIVPPVAQDGEIRMTQLTWRRFGIS